MIFALGWGRSDTSNRLKGQAQMLLRDRLDRIVRRHLPPGYTLEIKSKLKVMGECYGIGEKVIHLAHPVDTVGRLQVFLHEVIHAKLYHVDEEPQVPSHVSEYEAERLSLEWVSVEGFRVTSPMLEAAARNIVRQAEHDKRQGISLRPDVLEWAYYAAFSQRPSRRQIRTRARALKLLRGLP